jgi:8-amino-7-oxononanoate synthase
MNKSRIEIESIDGRHLYYKGREYLFFAGTSYLGISYDPIFQKMVTRELSKIGVNYGGSRRANFGFSGLDELELLFKEWWEVESFITTSSGSLSGLLVSKLIPNSAKVIYGCGVHPALRVFDSSQEIQIDPKQIKSYLDTVAPGIFCLVLNGVDPVTLEVLNWQEWIDLSPKHEYWFVVDDAHGVGVLGGGKGILGTLPEVIKSRVIFVGSLGKAFSLPGGFIAGPSRVVEKIWELSHFAGASPMIPAYAAAFVNYFEQVQMRIKRLHVLKAYLTAEMKKYELADWHHDSRLPIWTLPGTGIDEYLWESGILISSFSYPTVNDPLINRIVVNATHTERDLSHLGHAMNRLS